MAANRLINEDLIVRVRISKLGDAPKGNFIFDQDNIVVKGGVLEFPYTFEEAVLHEIFFDFALAPDPSKVYKAPDFLLDVQKPFNGYSTNQVLMILFGSFVIGLIAGWFIKRILSKRVK